MTSAVTTQQSTVALLGCGGIGNALVAALAESPHFRISGALVRDVARPRHRAVERVTNDLDEILAQRPDVVVECLGGMEPAASWCERVLDAGIPVVTANKLMVAAALPRLTAAAHRSGARLRFDAAVCAGVPVLEAVARLRWAGVRGIRGVINGTSQWIIDDVTRRRVSLEESLSEAISRGYAEPDPSADLSGRDSADKLCLLAAAAGFGPFAGTDIVCSGLTGPDGTLDADDLLDFQRWGALRIVANASFCCDSTGAPCVGALTVEPMLVPRRSALGLASGTETVVVVDTIRAGSVTLRGPGAGAQPTVAALLADVEATLARESSWVSRPLRAVLPAPAQHGARRRVVRVTAAAGQSLDGPRLLTAADAHGVRTAASDVRTNSALLCTEATECATRLFDAELTARGLRSSWVGVDDELWIAP